MILEVAILDVIPSREAAFERDFAEASTYISSGAAYRCGSSSLGP